MKTFGKIGIKQLNCSPKTIQIHQKNNSVSFELGVGIDFLTDKKMDEYYSEYGYNPNNDLDINTVNPMIYWKVAWNFFVIK